MQITDRKENITLVVKYIKRAARYDSSIRYRYRKL